MVIALRLLVILLAVSLVTGATSTVERRTRQSFWSEGVVDLDFCDWPRMPNARADDLWRSFGLVDDGARTWRMGRHRTLLATWYAGGAWLRPVSEAEVEEYDSYEKGKRRLEEQVPSASFSWLPPGSAEGMAYFTVATHGIPLRCFVSSWYVCLEDGGRPHRARESNLAARLGFADRVVPDRIRYGPLIFNVAFWIGFFHVLLAAPGWVRRTCRVRRGLCGKCGYPVGSQRVCSECGRRPPARR